LQKVSEYFEVRGNGLDNVLGYGVGYGGVDLDLAVQVDLASPRY
jgi:hypothetical protein